MDRKYFHVDTHKFAFQTNHGELNSDDGQYMAHCLNIIDTYINRGDAE